MSISIGKAKRIRSARAAITAERAFASFGQSPFCYSDPFGSAQGRLRGGSRAVYGAQERTSASGVRPIEAELTKVGEHHAKWGIVDT
jgi:hypothetical protein